MQIRQISSISPHSNSYFTHSLLLYNTKIKTAPSIDTGHILIWIVITNVTEVISQTRVFWKSDLVYTIKVWWIRPLQSTALYTGIFGTTTMTRYGRRAGGSRILLVPRMVLQLTVNLVSHTMLQFIHYKPLLLRIKHILNFYLELVRIT